MEDVKALARAGWHRLARTAAYALMPKFTASAMVVARDDQHGPVPWVLLVRKRTGGQQWGFPAGYVSYGRTIVATAAHELAEETGLTPAIGPANHLRTYRQPWAMHLDHLFLVAASGEPQVRDTAEIAQARWWPVDEMPELSREAAQALLEVPDLLSRPLPTVPNEPPRPAERAGGPQNCSKPG
ncbi:ADP-ribose pyrophosphatase YjhB (NUDIX family) [Kineosphaera limosa]|uniref:Nudix hydrolase domain-containing protein n=1 Tax=Kineosphaera limosa NBRC 100340 TaxID=1184609 RepID=K6VG69_9MICO|nr:NUDIX domain-containing protein [Kineosphaera limosa]NYE01432.1 ADP-ribose pyrophosphatase YjhB (NUDIX family) [Kineosphaera limosa]GAB95178.1 hypothetical protein KILIM_017_00230 [Kineosphaera limosa NBRC 100340]